MKAATLSLTVQLRALASGAGGGVAVLEAARGVLLAGREALDSEVCQAQHLRSSPYAPQNPSPP